MRVLIVILVCWAFCVQAQECEAGYAPAVVDHFFRTNQFPSSRNIWRYPVTASFTANEITQEFLYACTEAVAITYGIYADVGGSPGDLLATATSATAVHNGLVTTALSSSITLNTGDFVWFGFHTGTVECRASSTTSCSNSGWASSSGAWDAVWEGTSPSSGCYPAVNLVGSCTPCEAGYAPAVVDSFFRTNQFPSSRNVWRYPVTASFIANEITQEFLYACTEAVAITYGIYADIGGYPGDLLATATSATAVHNGLVTTALSSSFTLNTGDFVWFGFHTGTVECRASSTTSCSNSGWASSSGAWDAVWEGTSPSSGCYPAVNLVGTCASSGSTTTGGTTTTTDGTTTGTTTDGTTTGGTTTGTETTTDGGTTTGTESTTDGGTTTDGTTTGTETTTDGGTTTGGNGTTTGGNGTSTGTTTGGNGTSTGNGTTTGTTTGGNGTTTGGNGTSTGTTTGGNGTSTGVSTGGNSTSTSSTGGTGNPPTGTTTGASTAGGTSTGAVSAGTLAACATAAVWISTVLLL